MVERNPILRRGGCLVDIDVILIGVIQRSQSEPSYDESIWALIVEHGDDCTRYFRPARFLLFIVHPERFVQGEASLIAKTISFVLV